MRRVLVLAALITALAACASPPSASPAASVPPSAAPSATVSPPSPSQQVLTEAEATTLYLQIATDQNARYAVLHSKLNALYADPNLPEGSTDVRDTLLALAALCADTQVRLREVVWPPSVADYISRLDKSLMGVIQLSQASGFTNKPRLALLEAFLEQNGPDYLDPIRRALGLPANEGGLL